MATSHGNTPRFWAGRARREQLSGGTWARHGVGAIAAGSVVDGILYASARVLGESMCPEDVMYWTGGGLRSRDGGHTG